MMQQMMNLEGVYVSKFDFCQLGMETKGEAPVIPCDDMRRPSVPAKKRTTVLTNSANLAEVLRRAQCQGLHRHQHLINGRAKDCQVYPRRFIELIGDCIQKEIEDAKWRNKIAEKMVGVPVSYLGSISQVELQTSLEAFMPGKISSTTSAVCPLIASWPQKRERTKSSSLKVEESIQKSDARHQ